MLMQLEVVDHINIVVEEGWYFGWLVVAKRHIYWDSSDSQVDMSVLQLGLIIVEYWIYNSVLIHLPQTSR